MQTTTEKKQNAKTEWTTTELAREAGVSGGFIRQELLAGKIRGRKIGHFWVISGAEARRWLDSRT